MMMLVVACSQSAKETVSEAADATESAASAVVEEVTEAVVPNMDPMDVVGTYDIVISGTPEGDLSAVVDFKMEDDALVGSFSNEEGSLALEDLEIKGNSVIGKFYNEDYGMWIDLEMNPTPTDISGEVSASGFSFPMEGTRK